MSLERATRKMYGIACGRRLVHQAHLQLQIIDTEYKHVHVSCLEASFRMTFWRSGYVHLPDHLKTSSEDLLIATIGMSKFDVNSWSKGQVTQSIYVPEGTAIAVYVFSSTPPRPLGADLNAVRMVGILCDVELVVEAERFPAHRAVLAARSPVFHRMFGSDFKEKTQEHVDIKNFSKEIVAKFLEFVYSGEIADWAGREVDLLQLADFYMVDSLKAECVRRLTQVNGDSAITMLRLCIDTPTIPASVVKVASRVILDNWDRISATEEWVAFKNDCPLHAALIEGGLPG